MDLAEIVRPTEKRLLLEIAHTWLKLVRQAELSELATLPGISSLALPPTVETHDLKVKV